MMDVLQKIDSGTLKLAVIGMGYVGLPLAIGFGRKFDTVGFDIKPSRLEELRSGCDNTLATTPEELASAEKLRFSGDREDLRDRDVFIVTVPTPVDKYNRPDLTPLYGASSTVGEVMRPGAIVRVFVPLKRENKVSLTVLLSCATR